MKAGMTRRLRARASHVAAAEHGFTIVEGVVACLVLVIGLLGVLTMLTGSLRATTANNARVTATNLTRELIEAVRALPYSDMSGAGVQARLQARGFGSGSPWTIERRGVTFTLASTSCTFDDPADKLAATPPADVCTPAPSGATGDPNGEDFRRTTFDITWNEPGGRPRTFSQTTLVVNPTGGLGPRITSFTPVTQSITSALTTSASITWTTTAAETLNWIVDDGQSSGTVNGTTSFTSTWDLGTSGTGMEILDGSYQVTAQPFDDRGVAGEAKRANVVLNRRQPYAPPTLEGGHNTRLGDWVELQWTSNSERDILGYKAVWAGLDGIAGTFDDLQICPLLSEGTMLPPTTTACVDLAPPIGVDEVLRRRRRSQYRDGLARDGDRRILTLPAAEPAPEPAPLAAVTVTSVNNLPKLTWLAPSSGTSSFYRIYRDGSRYDRTSDASTTLHGRERRHERPPLLGHGRRQHVQRVRHAGAGDLVGMSLAEERGMTLVELLTGMIISLLVIGGALTTFNGFERGQRENDGRNDTTEVARTALDIQARQLRNLAKRVSSPVIDTLGPYDLIFQTSDPARTWVRYCLDTTTPPATTERARLWTAELAVSNAAAASPVTAAMRATCPGTGWTATQVVADYVTNRRTGTDRPMFEYALHGRHDLHGDRGDV